MGIVFAFLSALFATTKDIVSKKLAASLSGTASTIASFGFALPFYAILLAALWLLGYEDFSFSSTFLWLVLFRSISDAGAEWCKMSALKDGDLSLVAPILALSPVFLVFLAPFITGDSPTNGALIGVFFTVVGTLLLIDTVPKDEKGERKFRPLVLAMFGSLCFALNMCFDKLAVHNASPTFSGFAVTLGALLIFLPSALRSSQTVHDIKQHIVPCLVRGACELLFMVSKLTALVYLPTYHVIGFMRVSLLLSIVSGVVLFKEGNMKRRLLAGGCIFVGVMCLLYDLQ